MCLSDLRVYLCSSYLRIVCFYLFLGFCLCLSLGGCSGMFWFIFVLFIVTMVLYVLFMDRHYAGGFVCSFHGQTLCRWFCMFPSWTEKALFFVCSIDDELWVWACGNLYRECSFDIRYVCVWVCDDYKKCTLCEHEEILLSVCDFDLKKKAIETFIT